MDFEKVIEYALQKGVSDIHLSPKVSVFLRRNGKMEPVGKVLSNEEIKKIMEQILTKKQREQLERKKQIDFLYKSPHNHRLRGNAFYCNEGLALSFRVIQHEIPVFAKLGFPEFVRDTVMKARQGLVLIVGPTGQGKSTTLASILQERSRNLTEHILMIEDPIEYLIPSSKSIVQQRELNRDVQSFEEGIHGAMREDPDVLMIGELRDSETMAAALTMAETGHLVFATLHTNNAIQTITRILDSFSLEQKPQIRSQLASNLSLVISQRLIPTIEKGNRILAFEVLTMNYAIANYIRLDKTFQIPNVIQTDSSGNMIQFEQSLVNLVMAEKITKEIAEEYAQDKDQVKSLFELNGIGNQ
ncbi:PilT/PilU family type 4a pilus ATPase [Candidatus Gracilibacteria bacterium]|nr:PilT/PilU family type 4a pilus ATPase [Candidatus Gracilibacteria bacterium]